MVAEKEEPVKFADYKEPTDDQDAQQDSRTPAEIAYERAQQKRVCTPYQPLYIPNIHIIIQYTSSQCKTIHFFMQTSLITFVVKLHYSLL